MTKFRFLSYILIVTAVVIAYSNILDNEFVFDDTTTIVQNTMITNWNNLKDLFSHKYFSSSGIGDYLYSGEGSYRPLVTLSYFLDYALWNKQPFGYHLSNLIYHLLSVLLFFLVLQQLIPKKSIVLVALFYGIHPVLTEAVNCASFREDILCSLFFYAALFFYLKKTRFATLCFFVCSLCAFFSKEMAVSLVPVTLIINFAIRKERKLFTLKNAHLLLAVMFYGLIRFYIMKNPYQDAVPYPSPNAFINYTTMASIVLSYVRLCFFPVQLTLDYIVKSPPAHPYLSLFLLSATAMMVFCIGIYQIIKEKSSFIFIAALLFFVALIPVSNIVSLKNIMAERYLYLPFSFFALFFLSLFIFQLPKRIYLIGFISIFILCSMLTIRRNAQWTNSYLLWTSTLRTMPNSFHAHNNLAGWYDKQNEYDKAEYHYKRAFSIRPYDAIPYFNLGNTYKDQGRFKEAVSYYTQAIKRDPDVTEPYVNMGLCYAHMGDTKIAQDYFLQAIRINYSDASAHNNLGVVLSMNGNLNQAIKEHIIAIKLDPKNDNAYFNLGMCYYDKQNYKKTIAIFEKLFRLNPSHADGHFYAGICYASEGMKDKALIHYKIALQLNPHNEKVKDAIETLLQPSAEIK